MDMDPDIKDLLSQIPPPQYQEEDADSARLRLRVYSFQDLFDDMIFDEDSFLGPYIKTEVMDDKEHVWREDIVALPEILGSNFSYADFFQFNVKELPENFNGSFDTKGITDLFDANLDYKDLPELTIDPSALDMDEVILHEMIHLHEYVLTLLPPCYRDTYLWALYNHLKPQIPDLDERIESHASLVIQQAIQQIGGFHDILFLLKSYDLDLAKGYKLGTVFGYTYKDGETVYLHKLKTEEDQKD